MINKVIKFFDRLEDRVRFKLSKYPIIFAFIGGFAIVEFWRGVWQFTDWVFLKYFGLAIEGAWSNFISIVLGAIILLMTGLYVSLFLSDSTIILSGRKGEARKIFEKTEEEIEEEEQQITRLERKLDTIAKEIKSIKDELGQK